MEIEHTILSQESNMVSHKTFILSALLQLGFEPTHKGTFYLRDIILLAFQLKSSELNIKTLIEKLSKQIHISTKTIKTNIDYAFRLRNSTKAKQNFKAIFGFDYDCYYLTAKSILNFMLEKVNIDTI